MSSTYTAALFPGKTKLRHFKGGIYTFIMLAFDATNDTQVVVYVNEDGEWFTRTMDNMFEYEERSGLEGKRRFVVVK